MHFPVIGECLGWRTTDFEELYGDLSQCSMTKELARKVSGFYLLSPCEVWWIAEPVLNMSRSIADGTMSSWLLYFRNFTNFHTVSYIIWTKCASAAAILSNISADAPCLSIGKLKYQRDIAAKMKQLCYLIRTSHSSRSLGGTGYFLRWNRRGEFEH